MTPAPSPATPAEPDTSSVPPAEITARTAVTILDVILNSTVLVSVLLGIAAFVSLFFRWLTIGSDRYTTASLIKHLFALPAAQQDAPWYISLALIGLFLFPATGALGPAILYCVAHQNAALSVRSADGWAARLSGIGLGAQFFFLVWLWISNMAARGQADLRFVPGLAFWLIGAVGLLQLIYANARLARFPQAASPERPIEVHSLGTDLTAQDLAEAAGLENHSPPPPDHRAAWKAMLLVGAAGIVMPAWSYVLAVVAVVAAMWARADDVRSSDSGGRAVFAKWLRGREATWLSVFVVCLAIILVAGYSKRSQRAFIRNADVSSLRPGITKDDAQILAAAAGFGSGASPRSDDYSWTYRWGDYSTNKYKASQGAKLDLSMRFRDGVLEGVGGTAASSEHPVAWTWLLGPVILLASVIWVLRSARLKPDGTEVVDSDADARRVPRAIVVALVGGFVVIWLAGRVFGGPPNGRLSARAGAILGDTALVEWHLRHGCKADAQLTDGRTLLGVAAMSGHLDVVVCLLRNGANVNLLDKSSMPPLVLGMQHASVVKALLEAQADANRKDGTGQTPLQVACRIEALEAIPLLAAHGADINAADERNQSALHSAVQRSAPKLIPVLLAAGADPHALDKQGRVPLYYWHGDRSVPQAFVNHGWDVNRQDEKRRTLLHLWLEEAVAQPRSVGPADVDRMRGILELGADPDLRSESGTTARELAERLRSSARSAGSGKGLFETDRNRDARVGWARSIEGPLEKLLTAMH